MFGMRRSRIQRLVVPVVAAAGLLTLAGGGNSIALMDNTPTFGEQSFIALQGRVPRTWPDISMTCARGGSTVLHQKKSSAGGGAYFTFGPNASWSGGEAVCTAKLITYTRKGEPRVQDSLTFNVLAG
jgi:hypothetical protein